MFRGSKRSAEAPSEGEPDPKMIKASRIVVERLPKSLELATSPWSDDEHRELDASLLRRIGRLSPHQIMEDVVHAANVLSLLIMPTSVSKWIMSEFYGNGDEVIDLIESNKDLQVAISQAVGEKDFYAVRCLKILRKRQTVLTPWVKDKPLPRVVVENAWNVQYLGNYHKLLYANINSMPRQDAYSQHVSIVQSSGTGKSRMVDQQAMLVFTIPFNIRDATDRTAYPPPDKAIHAYLLHPPADVKSYYLTFLGEVFKECTTHVEQLPVQYETYATLASAWRDYLLQNRETFYRAVVRQSTTYWNDHEPSADASVPRAKDALKALISALDAKVIDSCSIGPQDVKVMIYFDEADVLSVAAPGDPEEKSFYDVLCSALADIAGIHMFTIFLSTNSHLANLAPSGAVLKSARGRTNASLLLAPVTEIPFDCSPKFPLVHNQLKFDDITSVDFLVQFGRPLFWTLLEHQSTTDGIRQEIVELAKAKLTAVAQLREPPHNTELKENAKLALLDVRLMLDFEPRREFSRSKEASLVASNLRIAWSVTASRDYVYSGYPSEPLLAEAAAQSLCVFRTELHQSIPEMLSSYMKNGLVQPGERGEVVGRLILCEAYDAAIEALYPRISIVRYSQGCPFVDFIKTLFQAKYAEQILNAVPDNVLRGRGEPFREAFKNAKVRFTHFSKMGDSRSICAEALLGAFVRCMAWICRTGERDIDLIIPVWLGGRLCEEQMTFLFIQIKRRVEAGTRKAYTIDEKAFPYCFSGIDSRPYVALVMELGVNSPIPPEVKVRKKQSTASALFEQTEVTETPSTPRKGKAPQVTPNTPSTVVLPSPPQYKGTRSQTNRAPLVHPRYNIYVYGCSSTVYKVIKDTERGAYAFLLANHYFLDEHPRHNVQTLQAVRRMKPMWTFDPVCWHWIDLPSIGTGFPDPGDTAYELKHIDPRTLVNVGDLGPHLEDKGWVHLGGDDDIPQPEDEGEDEVMGETD